MSEVESLGEYFFLFSFSGSNQGLVGSLSHTKKEIPQAQEWAWVGINHSPPACTTNCPARFWNLRYLSIDPSNQVPGIPLAGTNPGETIQPSAVSERIDKEATGTYYYTISTT